MELPHVRAHRRRQRRALLAVRGPDHHLRSRGPRWALRLGARHRPAVHRQWSRAAPDRPVGDGADRLVLDRPGEHAAPRRAHCPQAAGVLAGRSRGDRERRSHPCVRPEPRRADAALGERVDGCGLVGTSGAVRGQRRPRNQALRGRPGARNHRPVLGRHRHDRSSALVPQRRGLAVRGAESVPRRQAPGRSTHRGVVRTRPARRLRRPGRRGPRALGVGRRGLVRPGGPARHRETGARRRPPAPQHPRKQLTLFARMVDATGQPQLAGWTLDASQGEWRGPQDLRVRVRVRSRSG